MPHNPTLTHAIDRATDSPRGLLERSLARAVDFVAKPMTLRRAAAILATGLGLALLCLPIDEPAARLALRFQEGGDLRVGGDVRRELLFLQQYGALTSLLICFFVIRLLDPAKLRRLLDAVVAILATSLVVWVLKMLIGRPRWRVIQDSPMQGYDQVHHFSGPFRAFPLRRTVEGGDHAYVWFHSWEFWKDISSDLWSMPSSHTSAAFALSAVLIRLYPRLAPLTLPLAALVGFCRVFFGAHYVSDVVVGAAVGFVVACAVMDLAPISSRMSQEKSPKPEQIA